MTKTTKYVALAAGGAVLVIVLWYVFLEDWLLGRGVYIEKWAKVPPKQTDPTTPRASSGYQEKGTPDSGTEKKYEGTVEWGDIKVTPYTPKSGG